MSRKRWLRLHDGDNVAVALADLEAGEDAGLRLAERIPAGHKFSLVPIAKGAAIVKFGHRIAVAACDIAAGHHVHVQNVTAAVSEAGGAAASDTVAQPTPASLPTFDGFLRDDGRVGTRNYVGIVSTVNCSATVIRRIADAFDDTELREYSNVDGLCPISHTTGCGMAKDGPGIAQLRRTLGGYVLHPNMGAVLVVGLGCEVNDVASLLASAGVVESERLRTMTIQESGGTRAAIDKGVAIVRELLAHADRSRRQAVPASNIRLGLQCGGSDAFSAITANPALGHASDRVVASGGTVILGETPEIYGAEQLLLSRAQSPQVADGLRDKLAWWHSYASLHGASLDNNPSPGNIEGGISTIAEKSLGAVMKSGTSPLRGVCDYAAPIDAGGFVFMDSPGYDPCSVTGEIASGANIVCFTTGRGSVFGAKPVPSIKLASNSAMAARMADDIDYDCGTIIDGGRTLAEAGSEIFELIVRIAGGEKSASERNGLGDFEFVPWQIGAVL